MQGKEVYGSAAGGLGTIFMRPVFVPEVLHTVEEVGVVVGELRQENRGQHRRSWKSWAEAGFRRPTLGATAGSRARGVGGE